MDHQAYIDVVESELATAVSVVAAGPRDAGVPSCPEFDLDGLGTHLGQVCGFWIHALADADGRAKPEMLACNDPSARAEWLADRGRLLVVALRRTTAASPCWTWNPDDQTAGFVARRVAHEFTIHRVDAELAVGPADPIDATIAADGIDELFELAGVSPRGAVPEGDEATAGDAVDGDTSAQTVHLHGTDAEGEWFVRIGADSLQVTHEHAKGDVAVRASLSDLELLLYGRPTSGEVEMFGDESLVEVLQARLVR